MKSHDVASIFSWSLGDGGGGRSPAVAGHQAWKGGGKGRMVQVETLNPVLNPPGFKRLEV